jgi:hypothetical protein
MSSEPLQSTASPPAERRPAVWPWLLLPLVALTIFFVLRTAKDAPPQHHADAAEATAPSEDSGSH